MAFVQPSIYSAQDEDKIEVVGPGHLELTPEIRSHVEKQIREVRDGLAESSPIAVSLGEPTEDRPSYFARFRTTFDGREVAATAVGPDVHSVVRVARSNLQRQMRRLAGPRKDLFRKKPRHSFFDTRRAA